jgi:UDP-N-acetylglucosamine--N-acetylmuramyl-(pentapeptide) pyrophosphoryl-undecaprenol N-acetylglucosamine transferase
LAFAIPGRDSGRYRVTGRPIPSSAHDRVTARERFGLAPTETCVLVFGGSLGARSINMAAVDAFAARPGAIGSDVRVLHISGRRDHPDLLARELPVGYDLRDYLGLDDFAQALTAVDLVVARSGGSVFEIAAHGLPAILVPYPHASADHQSENARWMADAGAAVVVADHELSAERLGEQVAVLLGDRARLAAMAAAAASLARPDAARDVAAELLRAAA